MGGGRPGRKKKKEAKREHICEKRHVAPKESCCILSILSCAAALIVGEKETAQLIALSVSCAPGRIAASRELSGY